MGTRNISGVRKVLRGGKPRWFIDFPYTDKDGVRQRFRRDASVQNYSAALAEAARLMRRAAETGSVEESANDGAAPNGDDVRPVRRAGRSKSSTCRPIALRPQDATASCTSSA